MVVMGIFSMPGRSRGIRKEEIPLDPFSKPVLAKRRDTSA